MSQAGGGAAPEKSPAQRVAVRNRRTIGQFSVAGTYCSWTVDNLLRINAGEPNGEGGVHWIDVKGADEIAEVRRYFGKRWAGPGAFRPS
jgi:hypothetical protein